MNWIWVTSVRCGAIPSSSSNGSSSASGPNESPARRSIELIVRCAVLWRFGWPDEVLDGILRRRMERVPGTGAKLLDEYFATQFEPVFERGEYVVLWRRGEKRPWEQ